MVMNIFDIKTLCAPGLCWQSTVATVTGLIAKENVVSTFGVLFHVGEEVAEDDANLWSAVALHYTQLSASQLYAVQFAVCAVLRRYGRPSSAK